jgi:DNA replication regulator DPB11
LVVPHDVPIDLATLPEGAGDFALVTNWWVERCLHGKLLVDPTDSVLCRPFNKLSISGALFAYFAGDLQSADVSGFHDLVINITGFTGIELLQVSKAITLFGRVHTKCIGGHPS